MVAAIASAVLALASPLIGQTYENRVDTYPEPTSAPAVVHPTSLQPVENSPWLPKDFERIDMSPAGDRLVALNRGGLVFASLETGREAGRMSLTTSEYPQLSWLSRRRVLVVDCARDGFTCQRGRVIVIDPVDRRIVRDERFRDRTAHGSRVGSRYLLVLDPADDKRSPTAWIFGSGGSIGRRLDLRELRYVSAVSGSLVLGRGDGDRDRLLRLDVRRGTVAVRRRLPLAGSLELARPSPAGAVLLVGDCHCLKWPFDRSSLNSLGKPFPAGSRDAGAAGDGWAAGSDFIAQRASDVPGHQLLTRYRLDGTRRWSRRVAEPFMGAVIGHRLYLQRSPGPFHGDARRRFVVDVHSTRNGRLIRQVEGRFDLRRAAPLPDGSVPMLEGSESFSSCDDC